MTQKETMWKSGLWHGFFTEPMRLHEPFKNSMELELSFKDANEVGIISGSGRDRVGDFTIQGRYLKDAVSSCRFSKHYCSHTISYSGWRDDQRIIGYWLMNGYSGDFAIWPKALGEQVQLELEESKPVKIKNRIKRELVRV